MKNKTFNFRDWLKFDEESVGQPGQADQSDKAAADAVSVGFKQAMAGAPSGTSPATAVSDPKIQQTTIDFAAKDMTKQGLKPDIEKLATTLNTPAKSKKKSKKK